MNHLAALLLPWLRIRQLETENGYLCEKLESREREIDRLVNVARDNREIRAEAISNIESQAAAGWQRKLIAQKESYEALIEALEAQNEALLKAIRIGGNV